MDTHTLTLIETRTRRAHHSHEHVAHRRLGDGAVCCVKADNMTVLLRSYNYSEGQNLFTVLCLKFTADIRPVVIPLLASY